MSWIRHTEAAARMNVNPRTLAARDAAGNWLEYPEIVRWQRKPGAFIWMKLEQVDAWIERRDEAVQQLHAPYPVTVSGADRIAQDYASRGHKYVADLLNELSAY